MHLYTSNFTMIWYNDVHTR